MGFAPRQLLLLLVFFAYLYLTHFSLFCRYHAGVANNRFIGCLVGSLFRKKRVSFTSRLPTRSNPTIDEKKIRIHFKCLRILWRKEWDSLRDNYYFYLFFSHTYILLIFLYFVAITPGLQTTVSSVVWSARYFEKNGYPLRADFQPVRIPRLTKKKFGYTLSVSEFFGGKSGIRTHDTLPYT